MLEFEKVFFAYPGTEKNSGGIIKDISFSVSRGEFVALLGENGAGKSTVCRLANGLLKPVSGRVIISGDDTRQVKVSRIARKAGFLFQNPDRQLCRNTVRDEILFGLEFALSGDFPSGKKSAAETEAEKNRRCEEMLGLFGLDGNRDPFGLSRGERQQCALASVLAGRPELLILDEPTTGLDYRECEIIMGIVTRLNAEGTTVLMISHDMEIVADFSRRAIILSGGELIGDGPAREILKNRELLIRASLLPPQIASLAMNLGGGFRDIFSADEMAAAVARNVKGEQL